MKPRSNCGIRYLYAIFRHHLLIAPILLYNRNAMQIRYTVNMLHTFCQNLKLTFIVMPYPEHRLAWQSG